jgi:hypothetical protein
MDKESRYLLQLIDCNCNDCKFMGRDFESYNKWEEWNRDIALESFNKEKNKAIEDAQSIEDEKNREGMLRVAKGMKFIFNKSTCLHYGKCSKFDKQVYFIPNTCQIETQKCFEHRKNNYL